MRRERPPRSCSRRRGSKLAASGMGVAREEVCSAGNPFNREANMLWTIAIILFIAWLLGAFVWPVAGGLIHLLLVIAIVVVLFRIISGRRPVV